jgi:glycosyltransferase involved in cell wall biosynthesis
MFEKAGVETHVVADMTAFSHTELEWYGGQRDLWRMPIHATKFAASVKAGRRTIAQFAPDLVHVNSTTLAAAARAARLERVPTVWHVREPIAAGYFGFRRRWLTRRIRQDGDRVIAISQHDASRLDPATRCRVIYNFVDLDRFSRRQPAAAAKRAFDIRPTTRVVTMLGGVSPAKGTSTFVQAAALLEDAEALFVIAGAPPRVAPRGTRQLLRRVLGIDAYDRDVAEAAAPLVTRERVRFVGVQHDVVPLLAATDVLAFPATVPHFGRPIIEAAAMGIPAVASRLGASPELIVDRVTGHLVPPSDAHALASAIRGVLADTAQAQAMGEAGRRRARQLFDAETNATATFDVYRELLG